MPDCGVVPLNTGRGWIVGGTNATAGSWPWQASIHHNFTGSHICGGTLISSEWILTAGWCIENAALDSSPSEFTVYLGRQTQGGPNPNEVECNVAQIIVHPDYQDTLWNKDVALMKLSSPVTYSDYIRPICLASSSSRFSNNTLCWATGWGRLNFTEILPASYPLQEAEIAVIGQNQCRCQYTPVVALLNNTQITDEMMATLVDPCNVNKAQCGSRLELIL
ncbi:testisin-like [Nelusetta ayraudi]|uniref:testisin-like n=1 Tax=Nelusetta ayraudi TaxID=303726 RepID=UPI003F6FF54D